MICQSCGQNTATTHIKSIINGQLTELHLCGECAQKQGYSPYSPSMWSFGSLLGGLLGSSQQDKADVRRCPAFGASYQEIARSGQLGCAQCYQTFRAQLLPVIQKIHGSARHKGKSPGGSALRVPEKSPLAVTNEQKLSPLQEKKRELKRAVEAQDFERAAVLRDEIKEMEQNG